MKTHPYTFAHPKQFWSKAVSPGLSARDLIGGGETLVCQGDLVASAGSCFAANMVPYLEKSGITYLKTEYTHPIWSEVQRDNFSYDKFSAAYGNIYTARQLRQLIERCLKSHTPREDRQYEDGHVIDLLRPGLRYRASSDTEFDRLTARHLERTLEIFMRCSVFIFTLGLTECWAAKSDGTVYSACPGTVAGSYDPSLFQFVNLTCGETVSDLLVFIKLLRSINPSSRVILTVSPVPLVATATGQHVLTASTYSKAALRAAAEEVTRATKHVTYFPSYEMISGSHVKDDPYEDDRRSIKPAAIADVMEAFLQGCQLSGGVAAVSAPEAQRTPPALGNLAADAIRAECEEAMSDASA